MTATVTFVNNSPFTLAITLIRERVDQALELKPINFLLPLVLPGGNISIPFQVTGVKRRKNACMTAGISAFSIDSDYTFEATETECTTVS